MFNPGVFGNPASAPAYVPPLTARPGLQHRHEQLRAERRRRVAAERAERLLRKLLGDPEQATVSGGFTPLVQPRAPRPVHGRLQRQPGPTMPATRSTAATQLPARAARRVLADRCSSARRAGSARRRSRRRRRSRSRALASADDIRDLRPEHRDRRTRTPGPSASSARSAATWRSRCATSATGTRMPWTTENWNAANYRETGLSARTRSTTCEQFKLAQANCGQRRGRPRRHVRVLRARHGHGAAADLPGALHGAPIAGNAATTPALLHVDAVHELDVGRTRSNPFTRIRRASPTNLWTGNSGMWRTNALDGRASTRRTSGS